jgi:predicted enzyme related to lactoylglutathione lyase
MAKRTKAAKKKVAARKTAKRRPATKRATVQSATAKQASSKRAATTRSGTKRSTTQRTATKPRVSRSFARQGMITHTELASADPEATRVWCTAVLGWSFGDAMPTPAGPYHMWRFENDTGGGIRMHNPPETPGSIPYCEVSSIQTAYSKALTEGATEMLSPQEIPGNMGWIAIVAAPGGVPIGFWAPE